MMRWFWQWRLRVAKKKLSQALDALPQGWDTRVEECVPEIIKWSRAHTRVADLTKRLAK